MSTGGAGAGSDAGLTLITEEEERREEGARKRQEVKDLRQGSLKCVRFRKMATAARAEGLKRPVAWKAAGLDRWVQKTVKAECTTLRPIIWLHCRPRLLTKLKYSAKGRQ